jgi:tetratricopeptide (TPR) repeat protein
LSRSCLADWGISTRRNLSLLKYLQRIPLWLIPLTIAILLLLPVDQIPLTNDGSWYASVGVNLYHGRGLVDIRLSPILNRPLVPTLMAISFFFFGVSPLSAFIAVRGFFVLNAVLIYFVGKAFYDRWTGLIASLLVLTSYSINDWSALVHLDHVIPFFLLLFIYICFLAFENGKYQWFALAGFVLGLAYLTKEVALLFVPLPILSVMLIKYYRCRRLILGTLLLITVLALVVVPWLAYVYNTTHQSELLFGRAAYDIGRMFVNGETSGSMGRGSVLLHFSRYLNAFPNYYLWHLRPNFILAPLFVVAVIFTALSALKGNRSSSFLLLAIGLIIPMILFQGSVGFRSRQLVILFLLLYLALANTAMAPIRFLKHTRKQVKSSLAHTVLGVCSIAICTMLVFQFERDTPGNMRDFLKDFNTIQALNGHRREELDLSIYSDVNQAANWLRANLTPGTRMMGYKWFNRPIYFLSEGNCVLYDLPFLDSGEMDLTSTGENAQNVILLAVGDQLGNQNQQNMVYSDLLAVTEQSLLGEIEDKRIDYVIVGGQFRFLAFYFLSHPGFAKVADFRDGQIQIFKVMPGPLVKIHPKPIMALDMLSFFDALKQQNPEKFQALLTNYFVDALGWPSEDVHKVISGQIFTADLSSPITSDTYQYWSEKEWGLDGAITLQQQKRNRMPDNPWPYISLATLLQAKMTQETDAETLQSLSLKITALYEQAMVLAPDNQEIRDGVINAYQDLGHQYLDMDLVAKAIAAYERAADLEPDNMQTHLKLAEMYQILGQVDKSITVYTMIVERWPDMSDAHFRLGQAYEVQGDIKGAMAEYEKAIELEPTLTGAYIHLGDLYKSQDRTEEAIALYQAAARKNPTAAWSHIELGKAYLEQVNLP